MLNPLGTNNPKLEVSFKATVAINNRMPPIIGNKKIKLSQIQEKGEGTNKVTFTPKDSSVVKKNKC